MPVPDLIPRLSYSAAYWMFAGAFTLGWSLRATGRRHLPVRGPVLLASNHQSYLDPVLVGVSAPRRLAFLARSTLFDIPVIGPAIGVLGASPIDRGFGKDGLLTVLAELDRGKAVLMFPEGERSHDGRLQPLKPGVSLLVKRVACPIVPVGVAGVYEAWSRHARWPTPAPLLLPPGRAAVGVAFGPPIDPARYKGRSREAMLADLQAEIAKAHADAERVRRKPRPPGRQERGV